MSFRWTVDPQDLFDERYPQMLNWGLPRADADAMRAAITEMWAEGPGGWVYEWSRLAERYVAAGDHHRASLAYGWAKFPSLADEPKREALRLQTEQYLLAARDYPVEVERLVLTVTHRGAEVPVPVHLLSARNASVQVPVVIASGGVDTWKADQHQLWEQVVLRSGVRVLAFDLAGTGETSGVPMTPDGGNELVEGLVAHARTLGDGRVAHFGVSMGGHYSARTGLAGVVDAAVVLGGPVERTFEPGRRFGFGMEGILGNALGYDAMPDREEFTRVFTRFDMRHLLDQDVNAPMLVINGADDQHIPQEDTLVFEGRRDTTVHLLPDTGHCATSKLPEVMDLITGWLGTTLQTSGRA